MAKGGKRARAGRKPHTPGQPKRTQFNARITADLRERLERAAAGNGRSLAGEVEDRLENSFRDIGDLDQWGGRENWALGRLVGELARFASHSAEGCWRNNRFAFETLRVAIVRELEILSLHVPSDPTEAPAAVKELWPDHEQLGHFLAHGAWNQIKTAILPPADDGLKYHDARNAFPYIRKWLTIKPEWMPEEATAVAYMPRKR
jgi:hypothetical protein